MGMATELLWCLADKIESGRNMPLARNTDLHGGCQPGTLRRNPGDTGHTVSGLDRNLGKLQGMKRWMAVESVMGLGWVLDLVSLRCMLLD